MAVNRRGDKWRVQVSDRNGTLYPSKSFDSKKDAIAYEASLILIKEGGIKAKSRDMREMSLSQYWSRWADECRSEVSAGWRASQDQMWRDHIEPQLGLISLIEFDKSDIAHFMSRMRDKGLGAQMRQHLYNLLHKMMSDAVDIYEVRDANPVLKKFKPEKPKVQRKFFKPDTADRFLEDVSSHRLGVAFWIMTHCGFRTGEMQAMRRENIDLHTATITIDQQWVRKEKILGPLKNGEPLMVPMPDELVTYLREKLDPNMSPKAFVVTNQNGSMLSHNILYKELKALCRKHSLPSLSPHELRHTCSEYWIDRRGATKEDLKRLFNHASDASTTHYIHKTDERLRRLSQMAKPVKLRAVK